MSDERSRTIDRATLLRRGAAAGGALTLGGLLPTLASARRESITLNLVAYSTPKPVMAQLISSWQGTSQGQGVSFTQSYGPSTSQMQSVANGQPADFVFPSWPGDVQILVDAGLVNANWDKQSYKGKNGFRPVNPAAASQFKNFPVRPGQITLADKTLGGFEAAQKRWFDQGGLMYGIEAAAGGPSS